MTAQHEVELNGQTVAEEVERRMNAEYRGIWATNQELEEEWDRIFKKHSWVKFGLVAITLVISLVVLWHLETTPIAPLP